TRLIFALLNGLLDRFVIVTTYSSHFASLIHDPGPFGIRTLFNDMLICSLFEDICRSGEFSVGFSTSRELAHPLKTKKTIIKKIDDVHLRIKPLSTFTISLPPFIFTIF